jgi:RHS repeat-associated protein
MYRLFLIVFLFFSYSLKSYQTTNAAEEEIASVSTAEQISGFSEAEDFLIGNIINPLSGSLCLSKTDLIAKGAQNIYLTRYYNPPYMPDKFDDNQDWNEVKLYQYIQKEYKGWRILPHLPLYIISKNNQSVVLRVTFPNGLTLDYKVSNQGKTILNSEPNGMSNVQSDTPNGKKDLRNTKITIENDENIIIVQSSDGTKRIYNKINTNYYLLVKEVLPNSKILRYNYSSNKLISIESLDPFEKHIYASLKLTGYPYDTNQNFTASNSLGCSYINDQKTLNKKITEKKKVLGITTKEKHSFTYSLPNILTSISSPFYRNESISYNDKFLLDKYFGKNQIFSCEYKVFGNQNPHFKINKLNFPVGNQDSFIPVYEISYDIAIAGQKQGKTIVKKADGASTIYEFSKKMLMDRVSYYDDKNVLRKEKIYTRYDNNWLKSIELKDSGSRVYLKSFKYDGLGNPIEESFTGKIEGNNEEQTYTIKRKFSDDGFSNLLSEENDDGLIQNFSYLPNTNLILSKLTKDMNKILIREFYEYDSFNNLIKKIADDGTGLDKNDLTNVNERRLTKYQLRQSRPFLHMVDWLEEHCLNGSNEKLLKKVHYSYDKWGNIAQENIYDANANFAYSIYREYNERGDLLSETNPIKQKASYEYDEKGRLIKSHNFSGRITTNYIYDAKSRLKEAKEVTNELVHKKSFEYDPLDNLIFQKDHFGNETYYRNYDPIAKKSTQINYPDILTSDNSTKKIETKCFYNALGSKLNFIDANENSFEYKYNANLDPIVIIYPNKSKEIFIYFKNGKLKSHIARDGLEIRYKYDVLGRTILKEYYFDNKKLADASGCKEKFEYNSFHLVKKTNKNGYLTEYTYDFAGRKVADNFEGRVTEYSYDALGRIDKISKQNAENTLVINYKRDLLDRVIQEIKTDLHGKVLYKIEYEYDLNGNKNKIIKYIEHEQAIDYFEYDQFNRILLHRDATKNVTKKIYDENYINSIGQKVLKETILNPKKIKTVKIFDAFSNLFDKSVFDFKDNVISAIDYYYDANFNLIEQKNHLYEGLDYKMTITTLYEYNSDNLVKTLTRASKTKDERIVAYEYTNDGKIKSKILPDNTSLYYTYNPFGCLESLKSSDYIIDQYFEYDKLGRLVFAKDLAQKNEIARNLDPFGNIIKETIKIQNTISNPLFIEKTYDNFNRPINIRLFNNGYVRYSYDPLFIRKIDRYSHYDELQYSHSFDEFDLNGNLLKENLIYNHGEATYKRDLNGKVLEIKNPYFYQSCEYDEAENLIRTTKSFEKDPELVNYSYNDFDELIKEKSNKFEHNYLYDSNLNRVSKDKNEAIINDLDELEQIKDINLTYDKNGNVIQKETSDELISFTFDPLNRLIKAKKENIDIEFTYDAIGRRINKNVIDNGWFGNSYQENYLYDGNVEIGAFDLKGSSKNLKVLSYYPTKSISKPIAIEINRSVYLPIVDVQGNIIKLISSRGFTKEENDFTSFGENIDKDISVLNPWKYQGKRLDPELNLLYFGKRYYDPVIARWISIDPVGFEDSLNLYQYVKNNPFKFVDPYGENLLGWCLGVGEMLLGGSLMVTGAFIEIGSFGTLTFAVGIQEAAGLSLIGHGFSQAMIHSRDIFFSSSKTIETPIVMWENMNDNSIDDEKENKRHTHDQEALSDLAKEVKKKGVSNQDADTLLEWSEEYDFSARDDRGTTHWLDPPVDHIHLGGKHIPII